MKYHCAKSVPDINGNVETMCGIKLNRFESIPKYIYIREWFVNHFNNEYRCKKCNARVEVK